MTLTQWEEMKPFFTPQQCGEQMEYGFMLKVMALRRALNLPMIVHVGFELSGHAKESYHYEGRALDFHVQNASPRTVMAAIDKLGLFGGAGFYSWWNNPGFHIDDREATIYQRWHSRDRGKYDYLMKG